MKRLVNTFIFFSCVVSLTAQTIETLPAGVAQATDAIEKADMLNNLGKSYMAKSMLDSSLHYYRLALATSERAGYRKAFAVATHDLGEVYRLSGKYPEAEAQLRKAIDLWEELEDGLLRAGAQYNLSIVLAMVGQYDESEANLKQVIQTFEAAGDVYKIASAYQSFGNIYYARANFPEALGHYYTSLKLSEKIDDKKLVGYNHGNIGIIQLNNNDVESALTHFHKQRDATAEIGDLDGEVRGLANLAVAYRLLKNYDRALEYQEQAIQLSEKIGNNHLVAANVGNAGRLHEAKGDYGEALAAYLRSVALLETVGDQRMLAGMSFYAGNMYNELNQPQEAKALFAKSLALAQQLGVVALVADSYDGLQRANNLLGEYKEAYEHHQRYVQHRDSLYNEENTKKITRLEVQYEADKRQDSLRFVAEQEQLAIQKEMQLTALRYEYEKKQAQTRLEEERRQLLVEEEMKRQQIESDHAVAQAESKRREAEMLAEQQQRDTEAKVSIEREKGVRNFSLAGLTLLFGVGGLLFYQNRMRKKHNKKLTLLNTELDQANKAKLQFFNILNHDLRRPVANLIHFLHLKKDDAGLLDDDNKNRLELQTMEGAENLLNNMEDLLLWSKGQMENFSPHPTQVDVQDLFDVIRRQFMDEADTIEMVFTNDQGLTLYTDKHYLETILRNLTSNAIKALQHTEHPRIVWKAGTADGYVTLSIVDNGPGADSEQFRALYDETSVVGIKSGLGLHLIRDLARAIGSRIEVDAYRPQETAIRLFFKSHNGV